MKFLACKYQLEKVFTMGSVLKAGTRRYLVLVSLLERISSAITHHRTTFTLMVSPNVPAGGAPLLTARRPRRTCTGVPVLAAAADRPAGAGSGPVNYQRPWTRRGPAEVPAAAGVMSPPGRVGTSWSLGMGTGRGTSYCRSRRVPAAAAGRCVTLAGAGWPDRSL